MSQHSIDCTGAQVISLNITLNCNAPPELWSDANVGRIGGGWTWILYQTFSNDQSLISWEVQNVSLRSAISTKK